MSKRILTNYKKLNSSIKKAIQAEYPYGIEHHLTKMKHLIKGYFFDGFVFNYEDVTYLIEWNESERQNSFNIYNDVDSDDELVESEDFENID